MLPGDRHVVVGLEMGELARIALVVAEVRTVAVEHEKEFLDVLLSSTLRISSSSCVSWRGERM